MKWYQSFALAVLLIPWIACAPSDTKTAGITPPATTPQAADAPMVLPQVKDTLLPSGRHNWYLLGSREQNGLFIERTEFPKGYLGQPNVHDQDVYMTVLRGTAYLGFGNSIDTTKNVKVLGPGSFIKIPADQSHYEWFYDNCLIQLEGMGPQSTYYVSKARKEGEAP